MEAKLIEVLVKLVVWELVYMTGWFMLALWKKRNDVADIAWPLGFVVIAFWLVGRLGMANARLLVMLALVNIWGWRLALHIRTRNTDKKEDYRYKQMREKWGDSWQIKSLLQVFWLQGGLMLLVAAPIVVMGLWPGGKWGWLDWLGVVIWIIGFGFESIADKQLAEFAKTKKPGEIMQKGLWKYSRHPNYFGEILMWWGLGVMSVAGSGQWWGLVGPIVITFLILKVSGVPLLEKRWEGNKEWEKYKKKTSVLVPLPPGK